MRVEVPDMPPGFTLVATQGRGWVSFGWVRRVGGHVVSSRQGDRTELDALRTAREEAGLRSRRP